MKPKPPPTKRGALTDRSATFLIAASLAGGGALWAIGALVLAQLDGFDLKTWHALWAVGGVAFLASFAIPLPGSLTVLFLLLRNTWSLAAAAILGAAIGATLGSAFLLLAGRAFQRRLERRAKKGRFSRWVLKTSTALVHHATYAAVAVLIAIPFVPRAPILYASSLIRLRSVLLVVIIFGACVVRYGLVMIFVDRLAWW